MAVPQHPARNEYHDDFTDDLLAKTRDPIDTMDPGTFESSNVHSGIYDFSDRELFLRYLRDGVDAVYQYRNVDAATWQGLVEAKSKGRFVNDQIAYEYTYAKVGRDEMLEAARELGQSRVKRFILSP